MEDLFKCGEPLFNAALFERFKKNATQIPDRVGIFGVDVTVSDPINRVL